MRLTDEQREMVEANLSLAGYVLKSFRFPTRLYDDARAAAMYGLARAAASYNPSLAAFSTYAHKCIRSAIRDELLFHRSRGFSGFHSANFKAPLTISDISSEMSLTNVLESHYDYSTWSEPEDPAGMGIPISESPPSGGGNSLPKRSRQPVPGIRIHGVRRIVWKGQSDSFQARPWVPALKRNVNLGIFHPTEFGTMESAAAAAVRAVNAFVAHHDEHRDVPAAVASLKAQGLLPRKQMRERCAA